MLIRLFSLLAILATAAPCQVSVQVSTTKQAYLVGEPVWVVVEVRNVGATAIGYTSCVEHNLTITVENTAPRQRPPSLWGCSGAGMGGGVGGSYWCGPGDPPQLAAGASTSYRSQLTNYALGAGSYRLHVKGKAPVQSLPSNEGQYSQVEGAAFDVTLPIEVSEGSDQELWSAYAPYLAEADASNQDSQARLRARQTIVEMAPAILEKVIYGFAFGANATPSLAASGLGRMATPESRADLVALYYASGDLLLRRQIVPSLAYQATTDQLPFFQDVLPGSSTPTNSDVRASAALGLGHIGGDPVVPPLIGAAGNSSAAVRMAVAAALGNTRSPAAVPALIDMSGDQDNDVRQAVCGSIRGLTHYQWCDGSSEDTAARQTRWHRWWDANGAQIELHGDQECPAANAVLPRVP